MPGQAEPRTSTGQWATDRSHQGRLAIGIEGGCLGSGEGHPGKCCSFKITPTDSNYASLAQSTASKHSTKKNNAEVPWGTVFTQRKGAAMPGRTLAPLLIPCRNCLDMTVATGEALRQAGKSVTEWKRH